MICQVCESRPATIHITEIVNDQKKVLDLCEECAQEKGLSHGSGGFPSLLQHLVGERPPASTKKCPECGITFEEFRTKGRFGCPKDYEVFADDLAPLLEKIHNAKQHVGRVPAGRAPDAGRDERLRRLRRELSRAVAEEQYEEAARIRDEIRQTEEALRGAV
ncbi:MAG: UvrB/UvrC motif-containing protein [Planctomycetota bacterium]